MYIFVITFTCTCLRSTNKEADINTKKHTYHIVYNDNPYSCNVQYR